MNLEYGIMTACSGISMAIWTVHVLDYKWNKSTTILAYITSVFLYLFAGFAYFSINVFLGGLVEFLSLYIILFLFAKGNVWRNYIILLACFSFQGALFSPFFFVFDMVGTYINEMADERSLSLGQSQIDFVVRTTIAILIAVIFSKIFKKKYTGNAIVYKVMAYLYSVMTWVMFFSRRSHANSPDKESAVTIFGVIVLNMILVFVAGLFLTGLYNWFEAKRLEREQTKLKALIQDNYARLEQELVKPTTGQNLSGNLVVDAVIAGYNDYLKAKGIVFESMVQESEGLENVKVDVVMILDYLLSIASRTSENVESGSFVWLSIRTIHNSIFVRLDFSKAAETSFRRIGGWHINRELRQMGRKLDTVSKVAESHEGIMRIKDKEDECEVNLVLMR